MHYYDKQGDSCHEVVGKNGKVRPTNIRDARERGLVPSVTTILDVQSKPALVQWLQNQILEAAMASPFSNEDWHVDGWKRHIIGKSREIGKKAAERGNEIHDAMEAYFKNESYAEVNKTDVPFIEEAVQLVCHIFPGHIFYAEKSFAHKDGFGGRVDLWGADKDNNCVVIDFKSKDKTDVKDMVQYDDHRIQLAAYQVGLELPSNTRRFNLFISTNVDTPGLCVLRECKEFERYRNIFYALKELWCLKNNYRPEVV